MPAPDSNWLRLTPRIRTPGEIQSDSSGDPSWLGYWLQPIQDDHKFQIMRQGVVYPRARSPEPRMSQQITILNADQRRCDYATLI
jgi:hypothetical protein